MQNRFIKNIIFLLFLNLLVKPFWILGIDVAVQNRVGASAYGLYFALTLITLRLTCHFRIVNRQWFYILLLIVALFVLNTLWQMYLPALNIWLDSLLRTVVLLGGGAFIAYKTKLSPEINALLHNVRI